MSSTTPPSGPSPLSARERLVLETMVHHECRHDPAFVTRLTSWSPGGDEPAPARRPAPAPGAGALFAVVGVLVVLGVLVGLALAGLVAIAAAGVVLMLVAPVVLVLWARRRASR